MTADLIALTGLIGAGKTTAANTLQRYAGYELVKFAGPLKAMLAAIGLGPEYLEGKYKEKPCELLMGATPRHAMQTLGTEWGRECIHEAIWIHLWRSRVEALLAKGVNVVVDDCRFANELALVRKLGGRRVHIISLSCERESAHSSEDGLPLAHNDIVIENPMSGIAKFEGLILDRLDVPGKLTKRSETDESDQWNDCPRDV